MRDVIDRWEKDGIKYEIVLCGFDCETMDALGEIPPNYGISTQWHCGYCMFPKRPVIENGYNGILSYAPVHGGITFASEAPTKQMAYGFDCNHSGDRDMPHLKDLLWLRSECEKMAKCITVAAKIEPEYIKARRADLHEGRSKKWDRRRRRSKKRRVVNAIIKYHSELDKLHSISKVQASKLGMGAIINMLCGRL